MKIPASLTAVIALVSSCVAISASSPNLVVQDVKTYASPSGRYHLEVDPTERYGAGPGNCTLTEGGRVIWAAKLPFTFYEAMVTEEGTVAGYGYTHGETGFSFTLPRSVPNEVRAAIFDPAGKQLLGARFPRQMGQFATYSPSASGMLLRDSTFILRFSNEEGEKWHRYRLSTGEILSTVQLMPPPAAGSARCFVEEAVAISGTPLTLLRWWRHNDEPPESGVIFTLVEPGGDIVWELARLTDYSALPDAERERVEDAIRKDGAASSGAEPGRFELWFTSGHERVLHSVQKEGDAWTVKEVSRRPCVLPPQVEVEVPPPIAAPEPEKLGTISLDAPLLTGPVSDVQAFGFDDRGHIGFLRGSEHFVLIEQSGAALTEVPLKDTGDARLALAWIAGDRWLITASGHGDEAKTRAWWIDAGRKSLAEVAGFACPPVESLSGSGDGGFVALTEEWQKYSSTEALMAFDAAGALRWKIVANSGSDSGDFLSPESVTVTSKGEVAVLDVIRHIVVLFDLTGEHLRTVDLKKAWKREPNYPSKITADSDGGFVVGDFNGKPPFVRMTAAGKVRSSCGRGRHWRK